MSTSPPPLRIAVAGAGAIGRRHVDLLRSLDDCEVVGAADPAPAAAAHLQAQGVRTFADVDRMLDETRPQGVVVATPNALHERVAVACLERGIPVLIEKPIAHDLDSARRIAAAAQRTGVAAAVGHHRRHNPLLRAAKAFVESGALGRLVAVSAVDFRRKPDTYYAQAWRREPGGGPLLINGIHDLDCLRWLCGEIETVAAITARQARGFPVEDTAAATLRFANGAIGTLAISDAVQAPWAWEIVSGEEPDYPHEREDCYLVCGTKGSLAIPTLASWRNERGGGRGDPFVRTELHFVPADPWREELRHFAQVVRGEASPVTTVDDAMRTLAAAMAIHRSAATGTPVDVASLLR